MKMFFGNKRAPELVGLEEKRWINSPPLSLENLRGKVVLLDFWAYSCVNCIRTLPALKEMWKKYKNKRVVIIGIHTPEFEFEKEIGNLKYAVKKNGIEYPVASDPERINWEGYGNRYWPRCALINTEGEVIFEHVGESGYDEIEEKIIEELKRIGEIKNGAKKIEEKKRMYDREISKETYAGKLRNEGIPGRTCSKKGCDEFVDNENYRKDEINLQGDWSQEEEFIEYKGKEGGGWIAYRFYASEVNVVMAGAGNAKVELDGKKIEDKNSGEDVRGSEAKVEGADMYKIVKLKEYHDSVLKIYPFKGMRVYAFTFG